MCNVEDQRKNPNLIVMPIRQSERKFFMTTLIISVFEVENLWTFHECRRLMGTEFCVKKNIEQFSNKVNLSIISYHSFRQASFNFSFCAVESNLWCIEHMTNCALWIFEVLVVKNSLFDITWKFFLQIVYVDLSTQIIRWTRKLFSQMNDFHRNEDLREMKLFDNSENRNGSLTCNRLKETSL